MCSLLPAKQSFLITVLHRQLVATSMEFLARYIVIHDVYEVDNVSIRFTFIVGIEKPGNSSKRGQAFRTNGALSPVLSVRSTALYR